MFENALLAKSLLVLSVLVLLFCLERLFPAVIPCKQNVLRPLKNISLWAINSLSYPLVTLPLTLAAAEYGLQWREGWPGSWWFIVVDLVLLDIWIYWWHRANHAMPLLWRFHRVHHLDQWLDVSSSVRFHFGEVWLSAIARAMFICLAGISFQSVLLFESLVLIAAGFHHSNWRLPAKIEQLLSKVIITPSIHWVHHHAVTCDTDSNYGAILSCWDGLFLSRSPHKREAGMLIGVQGQSDQPLFKLLVNPFHRKSLQLH